MKNHKKSIISFIIFGIIIISGTIFYIINYSISNIKISIKNTQSSPEKEISNNNFINKKPVYSNVVINFAGDCTIAHDSKFNFNDSLIDVFQRNGNDTSYFFKNVSSIFKNDDLTIVNLENTFTNSNDRAIKQFNFKSDPLYAKALVDGNIEVVNIANNHIYDYKQKGFEDTLITLKANNINYFGEGYKYIKKLKGINFGFLGYRGFNNSQHLKNQIEQDIKYLKSKNCIVITNFHWGIEKSYYPNSTQINLAHFSIDKGADFIIGHHPHVIQGIEKYKNKIICYSLGNFCFGGNFNPKDKDSIILQVNYSFKNNIFKSYSIKAIPCSISSINNKNDYKPTPLTGIEQTRILNKLNNLSKKFSITLTDKFYNIDVKN